MLFFPTADEDFQYFRSQGYTGSINDMHYKALGDLGYTGSLNDRIHKYLTEEYGSFYEAMRDLRNGTLTFSLSSLSAYAVNNFDPSLVFDFKQNYYRTGGTDSTLSGSVTQTRASSATMTNSSGTLITVGNNVPRTDHHIYNGSAWVNEGILHESEARTNILTYSSMESTGWTFQSGSRSATTWVLTGASDATTITASTSTGGNGNRIYKTGIAGGTGVTCSISFYYKANTTVPFLHIRSNNGSGGPGVGACINTATGALTTGKTGGTNSTSAFATQNVEDVGSGWRRFTSTFPTFNTTQSWILHLSDSSATTAAGFAGTETIDVAGCQYEIGSTPSSYIPTSGSTVTRAAETLTVPAANLPYSSTNMSIQMDGRMTGENLTPIRWLEDANNAILLETGTNNFTFTQEASGTVDTVTGGSFTSGTFVAFNTSSRHGSIFINGAISGTALTANTTPTALPDLSATDLDLGYDFMGTIGEFRVWSDDLTDTGIEEAST